MGLPGGGGLLDQREDGAAFEVGEPGPGPSSRTRLHSQPIAPALVERLEAFAHGLGMTISLLRDLAGAQAVPTAGHHRGVDDPISGRVGAPCQLAYLALLNGIEGSASA